MKQTIEISGRECLLYNEGEKPKVLLIQTLGAQERGSIDTEVDMISEATDTSFVMAAFSISDWEVELTPWHDPTVSKRQTVGEHAGETLRYVTDELIPYLRQEHGELPIVLGGYSLDGLFSLWSGSESDGFAAIAAVSPSVWIAGWQDYASQHPVKTRYVYLSLGDREEHTRNKAIAQVGDNVSWEHEHLQQTLGADNTTLEWNPGNHFVDVARRTAKGFVWCIDKIVNSKLS
ncbi:MAG: esterase [Bacteroidales bacterium]|nr:esterase [Bacteroidales bacterium]